MKGLPKIYEFVKLPDRNILVMEKLGLSVQ